jgi:hypothetical protein
MLILAPTRVRSSEILCSLTGIERDLTYAKVADAIANNSNNII